MAVAVLAVFAASRWPNLLPLNFSMAYAIAFCSGAFARRLPWQAALLVLVVTDVLKNVLYYHAAAFNAFTLINYAAFAAIFALGRLAGPRLSSLKQAAGGMAGALLFYLITNTGAWLQNPEYTKTLSGWFQALTTGTAGWPQTWEFFRNTLLSGGLFTGILAAVFHAVEPEAHETDEETDTASEPAAEAAEHGAESTAAPNR